jgi:autophagy-related protein 9
MSGSSVWHGDASEMNVLRPNIHRKEEQEEDSEDDEVPQDFMIEARSPPKHSPVAGRSKGKRTSTAGAAEAKVPVPPMARSTSGGRAQPLYSIAGAKSPSRMAQPLLPTHHPVSQPPKPSDLDSEGRGRSATPSSVPRAPSSLGGASSDATGTRQTQKTMRGLDEYEKALWNWVNVYNLDAFLQEVYAYYEGNGIYSIALSRGLNLL